LKASQFIFLPTRNSFPQTSSHQTEELLSQNYHSDDISTVFLTLARSFQPIPATMSYGGGGYGGGRGGGGGSNGYDNYGSRGNHSSGYSNGYATYGLDIAVKLDAFRYLGFAS